jgi:hypothetical protein
MELKIVMTDHCKLTIFNSILYVVSERKIIKNISQSEVFMAPGSHVGYPIVTKVTTLG